MTSVKTNTSFKSVFLTMRNNNNIKEADIT